MLKKKTTQEKLTATSYARLKRRVAPLLARLEVMGEQLKEWFRAHPDVTELGEVQFHTSEQNRLDTKAIRAELGAGAARFEKAVTIESLHVKKAS